MGEDVPIFDEIANPSLFGVPVVSMLLALMRETEEMNFKVRPCIHKLRDNGSARRWVACVIGIVSFKITSRNRTGVLLTASAMRARIA